MSSPSSGRGLARGALRGADYPPYSPVVCREIGARHGLSKVCFVRVLIIFTTYGSFAVYSNFVRFVLRAFRLLLFPFCSMALHYICYYFDTPFWWSFTPLHGSHEQTFSRWLLSSRVSVYFLG